MQEKLDALVRTQAMQLFRQQGLHFTMQQVAEPLRHEITPKNSDKTAEKCPKCRSRILIHQEGEPKKKGSYSCSGGNCSSCGGRCGC